jgi:hypothetical protein
MRQKENLFGDILHQKHLQNYIGSASTSKFIKRFINHLIHLRGSKIVKAVVKKYGLKELIFIILEIYNPPGGGAINKVSEKLISFER